ncbi:conserved hypothetical protein [Methanococcus vannielii SB]|jgi:hypothetical protein|uniref:Uncharacterized protein n=1 Tax=Methanococcus vannielii (strain ATCC 35089 / DSM 1224 / JCM 13029 / OCM 148 / SB) TaxID=406327 RepID=A6UPW1_METVS|nr:hypothetical protein [Methanococcus vannielii]ABR54533.1 conserved hypothetical protein [Methanococcus vannielii SB]
MIEIISYQEFKGNDKAIVDRGFEKLVGELKEKYGAETLSSEIDDSELYTRIDELKIKFETLIDYITFCIKYGADLDVLSPSKLKISGNEMGETISYIIDFFKRFSEEYGIAFNVYVKKDVELDLDALKKGMYDDDDIFCFEEEDGLLRVKAVFSGEGKSEEVVIKNILVSLNPDIIVNKVITKPTEIEKETFSGLIAVEMFCNPFDIVEVAYKFLPLAVSFENSDIELDISEIQDIGNDLGGAIFELTHAAATMKGKN